MPIRCSVHSSVSSAPVETAIAGTLPCDESPGSFIVVAAVPHAGTDTGWVVCHLPMSASTMTLPLVGASIVAEPSKAVRPAPAAGIMGQAAGPPSIGGGKLSVMNTYTFGTG
jgi:hypothetical protein